MIVNFVVIVLLVAIDRATKVFMTAWLSDGPITAIEGVFRFRYLENTGAAFGIFQDGTLVLSIITGIVICVLLYMLIFGRDSSKLMKIALVMLIAGGAGNLYDRIAYGYVVDFIEPIFIDFAVFNFADILVNIGCGLFFIAILFFDKKKELRTGKNEAVTK